MGEPRIELTWDIGDLLSKHNDPRLKNVSVNGDRKDAEVMVTWHDGEVKRDSFIVPSETDTG